MICINRNEVQPPYITYGYLNLVKDFRNLMTQLAYLTRAYMVAVYSGFGNEEAIAKRLYDLPNRFKEKAELIFGTPLSEEFLTLLSLHVAYIQALVNAIKNADPATADYYTQQLYKNANDIAAHYARTNPFWDETQWKSLLYNYVSMLIQDAVALGAREYEKDLDIFDRMLLSALSMGDYQAEGFMQYLTVTKRDNI